MHAVHNYGFDNGNCGFDSLACLMTRNSLDPRQRRQTSMEIRAGAMDLFAKECDENGAPDMLTDAGLAHGIPDMTPAQYIAGMRLSAYGRGGLWADPLALHWAGVALGPYRFSV